MVIYLLFFSFVLHTSGFSTGMGCPPALPCGPGCEEEEDSSGCDVCECDDRGCPGGCADNTACINNLCLVNDDSNAGPFFIAKRSACRPVVCDLFCKFGFKHDENGCEICTCNEKDLCPLMFCLGKCVNSRCITAPHKQGTCPKPVGFGTCDERCSGDDSCPGDEKCCSNGCGHACMKPVMPRPKPGFCPVPLGFGICVEQCGGDHTCPGDEKCCSNGCGHVCMKPVNEKPGVCPKLPLSSSCIRGCPADGSCPGDLKCCKQCCKSGGCGGVCVEPVSCKLDFIWKGSVRKRKQKCKDCSCLKILHTSKELMKKACKKKQVKKACCPICQMLKN